MNKIKDELVKETCKLGKGEECCAYLAIGAGGFECAKGTRMAYSIEHRLAIGSMNAKGDNCQGVATHNSP